MKALFRSIIGGRNMGVDAVGILLLLAIAILGSSPLILAR